MTLKQRQTVTTNTTPDSVCKVNIPPVRFGQLWDSYVVGDPYRDPQTGEVPAGFSNQCALRMSATLHKVGVKMLSFTPKNLTPAPGSKSLGLVRLDSLPAATRAYELGQWLKLQPFCGLPKSPEDITGKEWEAKVTGRTGIIMFHAYWTRDGEASANASGGHIDLWNGARLTINGAEGLLSVLGRRVGVQSAHIPGTTIGYSDLRNSKIILFWEIK